MKHNTAAKNGADFATVAFAAAASFALLSVTSSGILLGVLLILAVLAIIAIILAVRRLPPATERT